mmetsp:Transcript_31002/g.70939  ORF Transcript_31002/g.70939 Transcript_31002/m.70939 type:complete len:147 (+) Transcript_31002:99-539(+)
MAAPGIQQEMNDVEVVAAAPAQDTMMEPKHSAGIDSTSSHVSVPKSGDQIYSKLLCWTCSIGEVLGSVVCGEHRFCFCFEDTSDCGLGGKDCGAGQGMGCIKCSGACELFMPEPRCGIYEKFFCLKCGCIPPLDKPFIVLNNKNIV